MTISRNRPLREPGEHLGELRESRTRRPKGHRRARVQISACLTVMTICVLISHLRRVP